jgi:hypothetical protein
MKLMSPQPSQPLLRIINFREAGVGGLPEGEELLLLLFILIHRKVHLAQQFLEAWVGAHGITIRSTTFLPGCPYRSACRRRSDHPSPGVDVRGREAAALPDLRAGRPDGGRGLRGLQLVDDVRRGRELLPCLAAFQADPTG